MKRSRGRVVDIDSVTELDERLAAGARDLRGRRFRGVDLRDRATELLACRVAGAVFVDCALPDDAVARLLAAGAQVRTSGDGTPLDVHRTTLYTATELYDTAFYGDSLDAQAYAWSRRRPSREDSLAAALHDHAIDEALAAWCRGRRIVGVMGGHALQRGEQGYTDAAHLGHGLGAGHVVATGGGPGAMEAANLGGRLSGFPVGVLDAALRRLATTPVFHPDVDAWLAPALAVAAEPGAVPSLGIPTWYYGHEPANVFATAIAKYVHNATREAVLLQVCNAGIVFLPGAAGTVQEVFQDACENYYADAATLAPMILVGHKYWSRDLPVWPLLRALAAGRHMQAHVHLVDTVAEAVSVVSRNDEVRRVVSSRVQP